MASAVEDDAPVRCIVIPSSPTAVAIEINPRCSFIVVVVVLVVRSSIAVAVEDDPLFRCSFTVVVVVLVVRSSIAVAVEDDPLFRCSFYRSCSYLSRAVFNSSGR